MKLHPFLASWIVLSAAVSGQTNVIKNGDFTKFGEEENLWDGVDSQNYLAGYRGNSWAVTESGKVGNLEMPLSVAFFDVNGDGMGDLLTADPVGIVRAYINVGTKTEPRFDHAEIVPLFPPQIAKDVRRNRALWTWDQSIPKIAFFDWNRRGTLDLLIGNYAGDILKVPNSGTAQKPAYRQPATYSSVRIPTNSKRPWGNLFAPCGVDWNRDGKPDLLVGEGSYSANSVYVLLNQSSGSEPKFTDDQRYYLCYGDGREQLVPTVVDYNGDGELDVLIGDRTGRVGVYLNPGGWKPNTELPLAKDIDFGGTTTLKQAVAPCAADYNGDGLFDLILGKSNGRVAVALNRGTKTEPQFDAPFELKGENVWANEVRPPQDWIFNYGINRGNLYANLGVSTEAAPDGGKALRGWYSPTPNKVFTMEDVTVDGQDTTDYFAYWLDEWHYHNIGWATDNRASNLFVIRQENLPLRVGKTYQLSFKIKGRGIQNGQCTLAFLGANENKASKFEKGERGRAKVIKDETKEEIVESVKFSSQKEWTTVEKTIPIRFRDRNIRALETPTLATLEFKFELLTLYGEGAPALGECSISQVRLVEKADAN